MTTLRNKVYIAGAFNMTTSKNNNFQNRHTRSSFISIVYVFLHFPPYDVWKAPSLIDDFRGLGESFPVFFLDDVSVFSFSMQFSLSSVIFCTSSDIEEVIYFLKLSAYNYFN